MRLPLEIFELGDIGVCDESRETGARNERQLVVCYSNQDDAGFEKIHGLVDLIMKKMLVPNLNEACLELKNMKERKWENLEQQG